MSTLASSRRAQIPWYSEISRNTALSAGVGLAFSLTLALAIAYRGPSAALLLLAAPVAGFFLISRPQGGMLLALAVVLVVPYWLTLGTSQLTILRLSSLCAAFTIFFAYRLRPRFTDLVMILFTMGMVLSWLLQYHDPTAGRILTLQLTPIGFYIGARVIHQRQILPVMLMVVAAGTLGALTVIYEFIQGAPLFLNPTEYLWNQTGSTLFRPGGVFGSPPGAATVLCIVLLFGFACFSELRGRKRALVLGCMVISLTALALTFTRTNMLALAAGVLLFLWLTRSSLFRPQRLTLALAGAAACYLLILPSFQSNTTFQEGIIRPKTFADRQHIWNTALPVATSNTHNLILGVGFGALGSPRVSIDAPVAADILSSPIIIQDSLHNQYLVVLVEQGGLGLAVLCLLLVVAFVIPAREAWRGSQPIPAALAASVLATAITMFTGTPFSHGASFALFMLVVGLAGRNDSWPLSRPAPYA